ncbi:siderophore-interacting protein, partial [Nonomuraea fuscirosea]
MFDVRVDRLERLSPSFLRVTFTGEDLHLFADNGFDQRLKLILPLPGHGLAHLPTGPDWYPRWRQLGDDRRNPMRTYTARTVRPEAAEV